MLQANQEFRYHVGSNSAKPYVVQLGSLLLMRVTTRSIVAVASPSRNLIGSGGRKIDLFATIPIFGYSFHLKWDILRRGLLSGRVWWWFCTSQVCLTTSIYGGCCIELGWLQWSAGYLTTRYNFFLPHRQIRKLWLTEICWWNQEDIRRVRCVIDKFSPHNSGWDEMGFGFESAIKREEVSDCFFWW